MRVIWPRLMTPLANYSYVPVQANFKPHPLITYINNLIKTKHLYQRLGTVVAFYKIK